MKNEHKIKRRIIKKREEISQSVDECKDGESKLRWAEDQLRRREEKYRYIYDNIQDIYYEINIDGIILELSPSVEKLTKYNRIELIGKSVYEIYAYPEEREAFLKAIKETGIVTDFEIIMKDKDGQLLTGSLCSRLVLDEKGDPYKIIGTMRDMTKRKHAEGALRESEQRLSDIIDFLPDATFVIELNGKVIAWNRAIEVMTGIRANDILGKRDYAYALPFYGIRRPILIDMVFKFDEEIEKQYLFVRKEGDVHLAEGNVYLKGEMRVLSAKASPLYDSRGNIVGAIESIRDITERRRAEKALKKRERELEEKSRNLEELNTALKVLLKQRELDKDELEERTMTNVKHLVLPYIEKLKKSSLETKDTAYISIIESNLKDIISPFSHRLSSKYMTFTPKELQVTNLIKEGKTTKDIAELLNASPGTIDFHRNNIRKKLNLKNRRANLRSYLLTLS